MSRQRRIRAALGGLAALAVLALLVWEVFEPPPRPAPPRTDGWERSGRLEIRWEIRDFELQFFDGEALWGTRHKQVWWSRDLGQTWNLAGRLGPPEDGRKAKLRHLVGQTRTARLLMRPRGIETLRVLRSGTVLAVLPPWIYRSTDRGRTWTRVHRFGQGPPPRGILRHWAEDRRGDLWYGEYSTGGPGVDSWVWRGRDDGQRWEMEMDFQERGRPGGARHIHGMQADPVRGRVWVTTGDRGDDIQIGWLEADGTWRRATGGDQHLKAVSLMFDAESVSWGADAPSGPFGIWRWNRRDATVERVTTLRGPVLFSTVLADGTKVVSTELEGAASDAALVVQRPGTDWQEVARMPPFRDEARRTWGTASFPLGEPLPDLLFNVDRLGRVERSAMLATLPQ